MSQTNPILRKAVVRVLRCQVALQKATTQAQVYRAEGALRSAERNAMRVWVQGTAEGRAARMRYLYQPMSMELEAAAAVSRAINQAKKEAVL